MSSIQDNSSLASLCLTHLKGYYDVFPKRDNLMTTLLLLSKPTPHRMELVLKINTNKPLFLIETVSCSHGNI